MKKIRIPYSDVIVLAESDIEPNDERFVNNILSNSCFPNFIYISLLKIYDTLVAFVIFYFFPSVKLLKL